MGLFRGVLLGTGAALVSVAAAQAADLPSRKAAPVEYVRVCDAYGSGFFFIPGTQTCLRIGGRVRADYALVPGRDMQTATAGSADVLVGGTTVAASVPSIPAITAAGVRNTTSFAGNQHLNGMEMRGRINVDARTQTAWGTVQTAFQLRMSRGNGVISFNDGASTRGHGSSSTLESAFIRFAGFTFGAARDNFSMMPSLTYGAGYWASFGNGAKQLAYTHSFGGGFSATIALQDHMDTLASSVDGSGDGTPYYADRTLPQVVGRIDFQQGWGSISLAGAAANINGRNTVNTFDASETVWAVTGGVTLNLPMLAAGSKLYMTAAYADGMTEYTTNYTSFKSTAFARDTGGFVMNHPSYVFESTGGVDRIETVKSWNIAALLEHYWAPQWRSIAWASYGQLDAPVTAAGRAWTGTTGFGDATVWNVGKQVAWLPVRDFEIGVEVIYSRVSQDVRAGAAASAAASTATNTVFRDSQSNVTGRLRVERNF